MPSNTRQVGDEGGAQCNALGTRAATAMHRGDIAEGFSLFEKAIAMAISADDPIDAINTLHEIECLVLHGECFVHAQPRYHASTQHSDDELPRFLATLHHNLALAALEQNKQSHERSPQPAAAREVRWNKDARLARAHRELLARMRTWRPSLPSDVSAPARSASMKNLEEP